MAPQTIGCLDGTQHHVAFDEVNTWLCPEPQALDEVLTSRGLMDKLKGFLKKDDRPLGERLLSLVPGMRYAERLGRNNAEKRRSPNADRDRFLAAPSVTQIDAGEGEPEVQELPDPDSPASRDPKPLEGEAAILRQAADIATHVFEAQMIIVQPI